MNGTKEAAILVAACAVCCAPLIGAAAAVAPPILLAGGAAVAIGAGLAQVARRRKGSADGERADPPPTPWMPVVSVRRTTRGGPTAYFATALRSQPRTRRT